MQSTRASAGLQCLKLQIPCVFAISDMRFCTVSIFQQPLPHKTGVARVAAVFGSTSGCSQPLPTSSLHLTLCGCPRGASPRSRAIAFDRIRASQFSSSSLSRLVCSPQFSSLLLVLSSPYYPPILLPLAAVAWSSFRHRSAILCLFALLYCPLSSSRCPTSVPGLFVSFLAVALLLYTPYYLSFSSFSCLFVRSWVRMSSLTAVLPPSSRALYQSIPP